MILSLNYEGFSLSFMKKFIKLDSGKFMKETRTTIYYTDELNDEFSLTQIQPRKIDGNYDYDGKPFTRKLARLFCYRIIATPLAWLFLKLSYGHKIVGKEKIREYVKSQKKATEKKGFMLFGNHTNDMADAYIPTMITFPNPAYVIVHANNVSMPFMGKITPYLGAIPLPDDLAAARNFKTSIDRKMAKAWPVVLYPEAHIWPFYTKIRPFTEVSFRYPIQYDVPVFSFTNTYQKKKFGKNPKIVTYIDGPFYADKDLDLKNRKMCERSILNTVELIKYVKKDETE